MSKEHINLSDWVTGDGSDESSQLQAAADEALRLETGVFLPEGVTVTIGSDVSFRGIEKVVLRGSIKVSAGARFIIGDSSQMRSGANIEIHEVLYEDSRVQSEPVLYVMGLKQAQLTIQRCHNVMFLADGSDIHTASISYNTINLGFINKIGFHCQAGDDGTLAWITECVFIGGDIKEINATGDYEMNNMVFYSPCLESGLINLEIGARWRFLGSRCERGTKFVLGPRTSRIVIEDAFVSNPTKMSPSAVVEDNGVDNHLITPWDQFTTRRVLLAVDQDSLILDNSADVDVKNITPGLFGFTATPGALLVDTGLIPVKGSSANAAHFSETSWNMPRLVVSTDATKSVRPAFTFYDKNKQPLGESSGMAIWPAVFDSPTSAWTYPDGVSSGSCVVASSDVAFARVQVYGAPNVVPFNRLEIIGVFSGASSDYPAQLVRRRLQRGEVQDSKPIYGSPRSGHRIGDWIATNVAESTVVSGSGSRISLSSTATMSAGDVIAVVTADNATHWREVVKFEGVRNNTAVLDKPVPGVLKYGERTVASRWQRAGSDV